MNRLLAIALLALPIVLPAQDAPPSANELYSLRQRLIAEHQAALGEIDAAHRAALAAYSEENSRRAVALGDAFRDAHTELAQSDLSGSERQSRLAEISDENQRKREEHAAWRDARYKEILDTHRKQRDAQFDNHNFRLNELAVQFRAGVPLTLPGPADVARENDGQQRAVTQSAQTTPPGALPGDVTASITTPAPGIPTSTSEQPLQPTRPDTRPTVETPLATPSTTTPEPISAVVTTETAAVINTSAAPLEFDIAFHAIGGISFSAPAARGVLEELPDHTLQGETMYVEATIANRGSATYAFDGNRITARLFEGALAPAFAAAPDIAVSAEYPLRMEVGQGRQLDLALFHRARRADAGDRAGAALTRVLTAGMRGRTSDGQRDDVEVKTLLWYTIDLQLEPSTGQDTNQAAHGVYMHVQFNEDGDIKESRGPFFYAP